jgi:hypothetical protein
MDTSGPICRAAGAVRLVMAMMFVFVLSAVWPMPAQGGSVDEYEAKAAFLYNFAKFVDWPVETFRDAVDPITICILGANPFGASLEQTIHGKDVSGRRLAIRQLTPREGAAGCRILFVDASERKRFRALLPATKGAGVLTVGEDDSFTTDGGVIDFKLEAGRIRLEINVAAAEFENLHISSKLLKLAQVVRRLP